MDIEEEKAERAFKYLQRHGYLDENLQLNTENETKIRRLYIAIGLSAVTILILLFIALSGNDIEVPACPTLPAIPACPQCPSLSCPSLTCPTPIIIYNQTARNFTIGVFQQINVTANST